MPQSTMTREVLSWSTEQWRELMRRVPTTAVVLGRMTKMSEHEARTNFRRVCGAVRSASRTNGELGESLADFLEVTLREAIEEWRIDASADVAELVTTRLGVSAARLVLPRLRERESGLFTDRQKSVSVDDAPLVEAPVAADDDSGVGNASALDDPWADPRAVVSKSIAPARGFLDQTERLVAALRETADSLSAWSGEVVSVVARLEAAATFTPSSRQAPQTAEVPSVADDETKSFGEDAQDPIGQLIDEPAQPAVVADVAESSPPMADGAAEAKASETAAAPPFFDEASPEVENAALIFHLPSEAHADQFESVEPAHSTADSGPAVAPGALKPAADEAEPVNAVSASDASATAVSTGPMDAEAPAAARPSALTAAEVPEAPHVPTPRPPSQTSKPVFVAAGPVDDGRGVDYLSAEAVAFDRNHLAEVPEDLAFPWDVGSPPLIAALVAQGRVGLAALVADAADEIPVRRTALRLLALAFDCDLSAFELMRGQLQEVGAETAGLHHDEAQVLLAGALRLGLERGWADLPLEPLLDRALDGPHHNEPFLRAAVDAVFAGVTSASGAVGGLQSATEKWLALPETVAEFREGLAFRTVTFQRGTEVVHHLTSSVGAFGRIFDDLVELAQLGTEGAALDDERLQRISAAAQRWSTDRGASRVITEAEKTISTTNQLRNPITGSAKRQMLSSCRSVADFLSDALATRAVVAGGSVMSKEGPFAAVLAEAASISTTGGTVPSVGAAALDRLLLWWREGGRPTGGGPSKIGDLLAAALLPVFEVPRDLDGRVLRPPTVAELASPAAHRGAPEQVDGYLAAGNIAAARQIMDSMPGGVAPELLDAAARADARHASQQDALKARAASVAVRLAAFEDDDELVRALLAQSDDVEASGAGRWDVARRELGALVARGEVALQRTHDEMRARATAAGAVADDVARVEARLDAGDEITALEFTTILESGEALPEAHDDAVLDFERFHPAAVAAAANADSDAIDAVAATVAGLGHDPAAALAEGRRGWRALKAQRLGGTTQADLNAVLRMLGLAPRAGQHRNTTQVRRAGHATFDVRATPIDGSYVPQFGSAALGRYDVTLVWDAASASRLFDLVQQNRRSQPNVVLYFGVLDVAQRSRLRQLSRRSSFSPLIIDEAVIGWLLAQPEPGWRITQRVTLPYTTINPYTPFAAGEVPPEVFVGRERERMAIESPTGSLFVYGGRQLGKSTLLRRVEMLFTEDPAPTADGQRVRRTGRVAVYIDLKDKSVGEAEEPAVLWRELGRRLQDERIIDKLGSNAGAGVVASRIKAWIDSDPSNRLLLLLDEADMFLQADFRTGAGSDAKRFPQLQALRNLMVETRRRFKPVFAGLHQVQRFHDSSNTPVAHGGDDICIGPLDAQDAKDLVVKPLQALGYRMASPEQVWRILLAANYQASLLQIVCDALVSGLASRPVAADGCIVVTPEDVDRVITDRLVRDLIGERFRWTINLDSRYHVIALIVALLSIEHPRAMHSAADVRTWCEDVWPAGFAPDVLTAREFNRYLEEMRGLGVLHRRGDDQYGLRSPSVIPLLGTRAALESELEDLGRHLELPQEYNPALNRRSVRAAGEGPVHRSPLTDLDLTLLTGAEGDTRGGVAVVVGSLALGLNDVVPALRQHLDDRQDERGYQVVLPAEVPARSAEQRRRGVLVVDATDPSVDGATARDVVWRIAARRDLRGVVVVGPEQWSAAVASAEDDAALPVVAVVRLQRWSTEAFRLWHDFRFDSPRLRTRLHEVTSGWPDLVLAAELRAAAGVGVDTVLTELEVPFSSAEQAAAFLDRMGVEPSVLAALVRRSVLVDEESGELVPVDPLAPDDLRDVLGEHPHAALEELEVAGTVERSQGDGATWVVDPVVARAVVDAAL